MAGKPLNIIVVGLDDFHLAQLEALPGASNYRFHALFTYHQLKQQDHFPVPELLSEGITRLQQFPDRVDAVIGYWDFPVSTVLPLLREAVGLPSPSLESVLKCEHKYWSRLIQREVIPDAVPQFVAVDPFAEEIPRSPPLPFPFWLKPIKSVLSYLGFRVTDMASLEHAIRLTRQQIGRYAEPFNLILERAERPPEIKAVDGFHCIAEAMISRGRQCTVEGYVWQGEVTVYGIIDSLSEGAEASSFSCYEYPSTLPPAVIERITALCRRVMPHIGYDNAPFNIEFFWDQERDAIRLLEINPRISKSHAPLFYRVDGCYHHQIMLDLALQRRPVFPHRQGRYRFAAKFMLRRYEDAIVIRTPSQEERQQLENEIAGTDIQISVEQGQQLSSLRDQDSYSYEVAVVFIGGDSTGDLQGKYRQVLDRLPLEFSPVA